MPNGTQTATDPVKPILDPLGVDQSVKRASWDAFHKSQTKEEFRKYFDTAPLPKEAKRALWDAKFGQQKAAAPAKPEDTGFWHAAGQEVKGLLQGIPQMGGAAPGQAAQIGADIASQWQLQSLPEKTPTGQLPARDLPYKLLTAATEFLGIPTGARGEEEAAAKGDVAGVLGHASVPASLPLLGEAVKSTLGHYHKVGGAVSVADEVSKKANLPPEQAKAAREAAAMPSIMKPLAYGQEYVYRVGPYIANKLAQADAAIHKNIGELAKGVSNFIDSKNPGGVVDPQFLKAYFSQMWNDIVQTGESKSPNMKLFVKKLDDAIVKGRKLSFEETNQHKTQINDDKMNLSGPPKAVAGKLADGLKNYLGGIASDADKTGKIKDSWDHYNKQERQRQIWRNYVGDLKNAADAGGRKVAGMILSNTSMFKEAVSKLAQYGLDAREAMDFMKHAKWFRDKGTQFQSAWRYAHSTPGGAAGFFATYAATKKWIPSMLAGAAAGLTSNYLVNLSRAARLPTELLKHGMRDLVGPRKFEAPPPEPGTGMPGVPSEPAPKPKPTQPALLPGVPPVEEAAPKLTKATRIQEQAVKDRPEWEAQERVHETKRLEDIARNPKATPEEKQAAEASLKAGMPGEAFETKPLSPEEERTYLDKARALDPRIQKSTTGIQRNLKVGYGLADRIKNRLAQDVQQVPEGQRGTGRLAEQARAREGMAKLRKEKGSTAGGGGKLEVTGGGAAEKAAEAKEVKGIHPGMRDLSGSAVVDLEDYLKVHSKEDLATAKGLLKKGRISEGQYREVLEHYVRTNLELKATPKE